MTPGRWLLVVGMIALALARPVGAEPELLERPLVTGRRGMVTSLNPLSSMAGMQILLRGGNAFDAAVATAVATTVVDPKNSTIGGQGFATIYVAKERRVRALNFFGPAPKAATVEALTGKDYTEGYLSTPVPSNLRGYQALLEAYGSMSWAEVLAPAIELAEQGFVLGEGDAALLEKLADRLKPYPASRKVFFPKGACPVPARSSSSPISPVRSDASPRWVPTTSTRVSWHAGSPRSSKSTTAC